MKNLYTCGIFMFFVSFLSTRAAASVTLTLQPDATAGKDALLHGLNTEVNVNYGSNVQFAADAWTFSNTPGTIRSVVEFDLSPITNGSMVISATLDLYAWDQTGGLGQHSDLSGPNDFILQRVITSWTESTVTWNSQPSTTSVNQVTSPGTSNPTQDYSINVTTLVQDMINDPANSHGFLLKLANESYYRRINFCSSDHSIAAKRPKLTIVYSPTGIADPHIELLDLNVFPIPAKNKLNVNVRPGHYDFTVSDMTGRTVLAGHMEGSERNIDLGDLVSGVYFITVRDEKAVGTKKIIIE
ncbi:MAG TPA: DNRLRE domain-containing protein [Bacteroidia bacterium]|jgi:hypothetical protein